MADSDSVTREDTDVVLERIGAQIVDNLSAAISAFVIFGLFTLLGGGLKSVSDPLGGAIAVFGLIIAFLTIFLYEPILEYYWDGQTLGKKASNIKVVKMDGRSIEGREAIVRNIPTLAFIIPYFGVFAYPVALAAMASSNERQRLFDRLADTTVVKDSS